jgi:hypothetical protein
LCGQLFVSQRNIGSAAAVAPKQSASIQEP